MTSLHSKEKPATEHQEKGETNGAQDHPSDVEALPASSAHVPLDPAIERSLRRKMDRRVVPLLALLYLLAFLDRSNIG